MPFGSVSVWDGVDYGDLDPEPMSPMPFGSVSVWDYGCHPQNRNRKILSPMPFGSVSVWDRTLEALKRCPRRCHQCLSAVCPCGTWLNTLQHATPTMVRHQCLSAVCPCGTSSRKQRLALRAGSVTNAFRQCVRVGHSGLRREHQPRFLIVTNAFRQCVRVGHTITITVQEDDKESPMPFGSVSVWDDH